jgi:hypothetical protein
MRARCQNRSEDRMDAAAPKPESPAPDVPSRHYDLTLMIGQPRFVFRNPNRGVTLQPDAILWTQDGREMRAPLNTIREVRMQSGGDWRNALNQCAITFTGGRMLTLTDGTAYGATDDAQTPIYRNFVRDLHRCLERAKLTSAVRFVAGYSQGRYMLVLACAIILGVIGVVAPLVLLFIVRKLEVLGVLIGGCAMCWPLAKMVMANQPRSYNPAYPPGELME